MGLVHQFAIIPKDSDVSIVSSDMDSVSISDVIIQYIGDSLKWINTNWNGKKMQNGISYYGFSFIEDGEIIKLKKILKQWVELFRLSPDTGKGRVSMVQAVTYQSDKQSVYFQGKLIVLENLTPILSPEEKKKRKREIENNLYDIFSKYGDRFR